MSTPKTITVNGLRFRLIGEWSNVKRRYARNGVRLSFHSGLGWMALTDDMAISGLHESAESAVASLFDFAKRCAARGKITERKLASLASRLGVKP